MLIQQRKIDFFPKFGRCFRSKCKRCYHMGYNTASFDTKAYKYYPCQYMKGFEHKISLFGHVIILKRQDNIFLLINNKYTLFFKIFLLKGTKFMKCLPTAKPVLNHSTRIIKIIVDGMLAFANHFKLF